MSSGRERWEVLFEEATRAVNGLTPLVPFVWNATDPVWSAWSKKMMHQDNFSNVGFFITNIGAVDVSMVVECSDDPTVAAIDSPEAVLLTPGQTYTFVTGIWKPYRYWRLSADSVAPTSIRWGLKGIRF